MNHVIKMSGKKIKCGFESEVNVQERERNLPLSCIVTPRIIEGYQLLLGMDAMLFFVEAKCFSVMLPALKPDKFRRWK